MERRRFVVMSLLLVATQACGSDRLAVTTAVEPYVPSQLLISGHQLSVGSCPAPGSIVAGPPVVVTDESFKPRASVPVSFSVVRGNGTLTRTVALTDDAGVATPGMWSLGSSAGANTVTAALTTGASLSFTVVTGVPAKVIAAYVGTLTGSHYYLADNGMYQYGYDYNSTPQAPPATLCSDSFYSRDSTQIFFYSVGGTAAAPGARGLFSTATVVSNGLLVHYQDVFDFDDEVYEVVPLTPARSSASSHCWITPCSER
jgi:hypothetical protein